MRDVGFFVIPSFVKVPQHSGSRAFRFSLRDINKYVQIRSLYSGNRLRFLQCYSDDGATGCLQTGQLGL